MDLTGYTKYEGSGEWSALYAPDGTLVEYGDHYIVEEKIEELAGLKVVQSDDFCFGSSDVHQTIEEVHNATGLREAREALPSGTLLGVTWWSDTTPTPEVIATLRSLS